MQVSARATYEIITFHENDEGHDREGGFTDPKNPWGGFRYELPEEICGDEAAAWIAENAEVVVFDSMFEAAEFVVDFPGAVWDFTDHCDPNLRGMTVTLHIEDHVEGVFAIADFLQKMQDTKLARSARRSLDAAFAPLEQLMPAFDIDGETPFVEHDGEAVLRFKWIESGVAIEYASNHDINIVPETDRVVCGMAVTPMMDLHLIFGVWVDAKTARFGT